MAEPELGLKVSLLEGIDLQMGQEVIIPSPFILEMEKQTHRKEGVHLAYLGIYEQHQYLVNGFPDIYPTAGRLSYPKHIGF